MSTLVEDDFFFVSSTVVEPTSFVCLACGFDSDDPVEAHAHFTKECGLR